MVPPPDSVSLNWQYLSGYQIAYGEIKQIWGVNGSSHKVHNPRKKLDHAAQLVNEGKRFVLVLDNIDWEFYSFCS